MPAKILHGSGLRALLRTGDPSAMPKFTTNRRVQHSASDMFDLVADVEKYPSFVPLCQALTVRRRTDGEGGTQILIAGMTVAYKLLRETFTSRVTLDRANMQISVPYRWKCGSFASKRNAETFRSIRTISSSVSTGSGLSRTFP